MALVFICDTCGKKYDASLSGPSIMYMDGNLRTQVRSETEPCRECQEKIDQAIAKAKEAIKNDGQQAN